MKEVQEKAIDELKAQKKLLIKEVKSLRSKAIHTEEMNADFTKEFEVLRELMEKTKEKCYHN